MFEKKKGKYSKSNLNNDLKEKIESYSKKKLKCNDLDGHEYEKKI